MTESVPGYITSEQAAKRLGAPYRTLMRWVEKGLVEPYLAGARKRAARLWSPRHIHEARLVQMLRSAGIGEEALRDAMARVRAAEDPFRDSLLVYAADGSLSAIQPNDEPVGVGSYPLVIVVDLAGLRVGARETAE